MTSSIVGRVVVVRHGKTPINDRNGFGGQLDCTETDLTELGHKQAKQAGRQLKQLEFRFDDAFSSPLTRARKTADHILCETGSKTGLQIRQQLIEMDDGQWTGKAASEVERTVGSKAYATRNHWQAKRPYGESFHAVANRLTDIFLSDLLPRAAGGRDVLVATHWNPARVAFLIGKAASEIPGGNLKDSVDHLIKRISPEGFEHLTFDNAESLVLSVRSDLTVAALERLPIILKHVA